VLHRDLKPHNVMLLRKGGAKLMDFGIARVLEEGRATRAGEVVGTPAYLPPEFLDSALTSDVRSDVYLAGNLLLELLTFRPRGILAKHRADCPPAWAALVHEAMRPDPDERPATIADFWKRLQTGQSHPPAAPVAKPSTGPTADPVTDYDRWKKQIEERKAQAARAAKVFDYARAVAILEAVPSNHRDNALLADWTGKRDRLAELWDRVESGWREMSEDELIEDLEEIVELHPDHPRAKPWLPQFGSTAERQRKKSGRNKVGTTIANRIGMQFAWVPRGESWLGGGDGKGGTKKFTLQQGLWCGVYPVTQAEWQAVLGDTPSHFKGNLRYPVERVSWNRVQEFVGKLNHQCSGDGLVYRLPTEEEWEYICRGGPLSQDQSKYHFYFARSKTELTPHPSNNLSSRQANFNGNYPAGYDDKGPYLQRPSDVGLYLPNPLGIYDLHGNVWEWTTSQAGCDRMIRGGGWNDPGAHGTASLRSWREPGNAYDDLGFRVLAVPLRK
jgi:eukaryotic-like serine/threonine-protein kinase